MKPSGIVLEVQDGTLYCDEMATTGCQVNIRVGNEEPIVTYAKAEGIQVERYCLSMKISQNVSFVTYRKQLTLNPSIKNLC